MKLDPRINQRFDELATEARDLRPETRRRIVVGASDEELVAKWATSSLHLLRAVFGEDSVHYQNFQEGYQIFKSIGDLDYCLGAFFSAKEDFQGGYLFNIRGLIQAELFEETLEQAAELLNAGYKDPACVIAGVVLETALKELCTRNTLQHGKLDKMNVDLCKAGVYNMALQKQITAWAARRNDAAHGNWVNYNHKDVEDLIRGVERFVAEHI